MLYQKLFFNSLPLALALTTVAIDSLWEAAQAAQFDFSYRSSAGLISGVLEGNIRPDNNTIFVTAITSSQFNGSPAPNLPFVGSYSAYRANVGSIGGQAVLSLNGSTMDFVACTTINCSSSGFSFVPMGSIFPPSFPTVPQFISTGSYGGASEPYNAANFTVSEVVIPEPSAVIALLVMGGGLLSIKRGKYD